MLFRRRRLRPLLLLFLGIGIIAEIVALSPSSLEDSKVSPAPVDPEVYNGDNEPSLVPGIPKRIAEYSIEKFDYVSVQGGAKLWKIEANKAFLYNPERLMHGRGIRAYLYNADENVTIITGLEAKYFLNEKDLEVFGKVKTIFPDGFEIDSEYLRYKPNERRILMPTQYAVKGDGKESDGQIFQFNSQGLDYDMAQSRINLPKAAKVTLVKTTPNASATPGVPEKTVIESDHCWIDRIAHLAKFTMYPTRPLKARFVRITQPTLFTRSRRADLRYGNFANVLEYLNAYDDVLVKETQAPKRIQQGIEDEDDDPFPLRYATAGRADFDTQRDIIKLSQFPQAYQDGDTVIGDVILMHRDTDVIEIEHANAFSEGSEKRPPVSPTPIPAHLPKRKAIP